MKITNTADSDFRKTIIGDLFGGLGGVLVALPSAIAFGLIIYAPLGGALASRGAIAGIIGTIILSIFAAVFGGTKRLITAPCAPAAAVMAVLAKDLVTRGMPVDGIPGFLLLVALCAGIFQVLIGLVGAGRFIKYIPYPVVAGYLSGVGCLIFIGQLPKFLGLPNELPLYKGLVELSSWRWEAVTVGLVTIIGMVYADRLTKKIPATIIALLSGVICYFIISMFIPQLLNISGNPFIIGPIVSGDFNYLNLLKEQWHAMFTLGFSSLIHLFVPAVTLAVLLSMDTLKTCVVLDALTRNRHNSNKELLGQGLGNIGSALTSGMPGAGTMGPTLVSFTSGAETRFAGIFMGAFAFIIFLFLSSLMAWIPISALAGILLVVAVRMIDKKNFKLLKSRQTILDFIVILAVVISAISLSLISAAGVGIAMAIMLFLRDHIKRSVIRRQFLGSTTFSKKKRLSKEMTVLEEKGAETVIFELQGQLFFGTTDQLFSEVSAFFGKCKTLVLDMRRIQSLDYTAAHLLKQIEQQLIESGARFLLASVPDSSAHGESIKVYMRELGFREETFFPTLDSALEQCEDIILKRELPNDDLNDKELELEEIDFFTSIKKEHLEILLKKMKLKTLKEGELAFKQSDLGNEIFFIRKGEIKIVLPLPNGSFHHLATFNKGDFFGDMSFLDKKKRSANALVASESSLFILSRKDFEEIVDEKPEVGAVVYERLAYCLALRLRTTNREVTALQEA